MRPSKDIYRYLDYPSWLRDEYDARRTEEPGFTHRSFSQLCGYRSSGALALIMSGRRNLSRSAAQRVSDLFELEDGERAHLFRMLDYEQAADFAARAAVVTRMRASKRFAEHWRGTIDAYEFYGDPWVPVVREFVSLDTFTEDPQALAALAYADVTPEQCAIALEKLESIGQLERDADGRLRHTQRVVATPAEVRSDALKTFQRMMMRLAADALDEQAPEQRDMRVTTMAISHDQSRRIKALVTQMHKEVLDIVSEDEPIEVLYQLNTQLFALTRPSLPAAELPDA
ncbi:MAG: hypothetical protein ACI81R_003050 [Bradymonadia bacterium]|jgi:uncharacterized protein (TIGR02147 family)